MNMIEVDGPPWWPRLGVAYAPQVLSLSLAGQNWRKNIWLCRWPRWLIATIFERGAFSATGILCKLILRLQDEPDACSISNYTASGLQNRRGSEQY
jgi:hypothetical protein